MSGTRDPNDQSQGSTVARAEEGREGRRHQQQQQQNQRNGGKRRIRKAGNMVMYPFRRINNLYSRRTTTSNTECPSSSTSSSSFSFGSSSSYPHYYGERPIPGCYFCFLQPPVAADSPIEPSTSNPSNPDPSSYEFVRNLIERNDFYGADCNVHRDGQCPQRDGT